MGTKTLTFRKRTASDTWHFVSSCRWWPSTNYKAARYGSGELCNECISKSRKKKELPPADVQTSRENTLYGGD